MLCKPKRAWCVISRPGVKVQLTPLQDAWLTAIADVRGVSRPEVVREAITWLAARETDRVSRTRHYRLIAFIARQELWNPVDEHLDAAARSGRPGPHPRPGRRRRPARLSEALAALSAVKAPGRDAGAGRTAGEATARRRRARWPPAGPPASPSRAPSLICIRKFGPLDARRPGNCVLWRMANRGLPTVQARISWELLAALDRECERRGWTRTQLVTQLLEQELNGPASSTSGQRRKRRRTKR